MTERRSHWEQIYRTKTPEQVSWTQAIPQPSLELILAAQLPKNAPIIDIGGGDSLLVDHLLELGYSDLTVLDISGSAIERAKERLGSKAAEVHWIVGDIVEFEPERNYALWHDRAAFHFLTSSEDQNLYRLAVERAKVQHLILGTFSVNGPIKCSGLEIVQNDCESLESLFPSLTLVHCEERDHHTPFDSIQRFVFGRYTR